MKVSFDDVDLVVTSDNGSVVSDYDMTRLLFINNKGQIVNVKFFASDNIDADQANKVFIINDKIYVIAGKNWQTAFIINLNVCLNTVLMVIS